MYFLRKEQVSMIDGQTRLDDLNLHFSLEPVWIKRIFFWKSDLKNQRKAANATLLANFWFEQANTTILLSTFPCSIYCHGTLFGAGRVKINTAKNQRNMDSNVSNPKCGSVCYSSRAANAGLLANFCGLNCSLEVISNFSVFTELQQRKRFIIIEHSKEKSSDKKVVWFFLQELH